MNPLSVKKVEIDYNRPINSRAKLDTGKLCNYKCEFCYYKNHLNERDELNKIYKRIDYLFNYGIKEIDLSGGESSVEPNWFKILEYCQNKFERISCLSHGGKFSDKEFIRKSYDLGLREILFSLHCTDENTHDKIVGKKGAFKNLLRAIENAHDLKIEVRINTTIYQENFNKIDTNFIKKINPTQVNFIALNYWRDNQDFDAIDYDSICRYVSQYIDDLKTFMEVNARYFPYCFMPDKEKFIKNHYHHIYDMKDWNKAVYNENLDTSIYYTEKQKVKQSFEEAERLRLYSCFKNKECLNCKYFYVCDGMEKQLEGKVNPKPIFGEKIKIVW
jgi:radical SAM protein with 4Fe4S-binding SPASM domain